MSLFDVRSTGNFKQASNRLELELELELGCPLKASGFELWAVDRRSSVVACRSSARRKLRQPRQPREPRQTHTRPDSRTQSFTWPRMLRRRSAASRMRGFVCFGRGWLTSPCPIEPMLACNVGRTQRPELAGSAERASSGPSLGIIGRFVPSSRLKAQGAREP